MRRWGDVVKTRDVGRRVTYRLASHPTSEALEPTYPEAGTRLDQIWARRAEVTG